MRDSQCGFLVEALVCCPHIQIEEVGGDEFCLQTELDKIAGGVNTNIDEFRWMAQLEYKIQSLEIFVNYIEWKEAKPIYF